MVTRLTIVTANLDKDRPGTLDYIGMLSRGYRPAVLALQERGRGLRSTRVRGNGVNVTHKRWRTLGLLGAHRGVAVGRVQLHNRTIRVLSVHGLHRRTMGRITQRAHYALLARWTRRMARKGRLWIVAGDFNNHPPTIAKQLGGKTVAYDDDGVDGVIVGPGLDGHERAIDRRGIRARWTGHPAVVARVWLEP